MLKKLGPFQILDVIGRGGMGVVYRGIDPMIGRPVAVKVIRLIGYNDSDEQEWLKDRLFREARAAGGLNHPGIVTIYQVGQEGEVAYIAMEFVDGTGLDNILASGSMSKAELCNILCETAAALDYAHKRGLVHRDIKPANIMVTAAGVTKVTDFGIAKTMLGQTATKTGLVLGTPFYMSPEQIRGKTLDGRSDQFALAVMAYEIFTGRKPFEAEQLTSICYQIVHEEPLSPEDVNPGVGGELASVLKKGLAKEAEARYATCSAFTIALKTAALRAAATAEDATAPIAIPAPVEVNPETIAPAQARVSMKYVPWAAVALALALVGLWFVKVELPRQNHARAVATPLLARSTGITVTALKTATPSKRVTASESEPSAILQPTPGVATPGVAAMVAVKKPATALKPIEEAEGALKATPEPENVLQAAPVESHAPRTRQGFMVWTGHVPAGGLVTIDGQNASTGSISGSLPRSPLRVDIYPAESGPAGLTVFTSDSRYLSPAMIRVPSGSASFVFDPRHATDIVVFESPNAQNDWGRLVISVRNPKISGCVIEWRSQ